MWSNKVYFEIAIWWPGMKNYGKSDRFTTVEEAIKERDRLLELGYQNVHVKKVTVAVNQETMTNLPQP